MSWPTDVGRPFAGVPHQLQVCRIVETFSEDCSADLQRGLDLKAHSIGVTAFRVEHQKK